MDGTSTYIDKASSPKYFFKFKPPITSTSKTIFFPSSVSLFISLFNVPLKDPSYAYIMMEKKVCSILNDFKPQMPDGFFWEFNARAKNYGLTFFNLDIIHNERYFGETRIYHWSKLPLVSYNNLLGMIKIKFFD